MKHLFTINSEGAVEALPEAWLFEAFANIRKKYKSDSIASVELGLVYFAADYRSNYLSVKNIDARIEKIRKDLFSQRNIVVDDTTIVAINFYAESQDDVNIRLIKAIRSAVERAIVTIDSADIVDLEEIKKLSEIAAKLPGMMQNLAELEKFVKKGTQLEEGVVGSGEKGLYEDAM